MYQFSNIVYAQNTFHSENVDDSFICGTPPSTDPDPLNIYSKSIDPAYLNSFEPITFNVFFWRINKSDGSYTDTSNIPGAPLTPQRAQMGIESLNNAFASLNICFNLVGMDTINSTAHHTLSSLGAIHNYAVNNNYAKTNAFNIYIPHRLGNGSGQGSYNNTHLAMNDANIFGRTIVHEMGHNFNLIHTFGNSNQRPDPIYCERVTRDINDPVYNASDINGAIARGDQLHDTNAVPNFFKEQHNYFAYAVEAANIGYTWSQAKAIVNKIVATGFITEPNPTAIEQALIDYGFTTTEINHLKFNNGVNYAYMDAATCSYIPDNRINDLNSPFFKDCGGSPYEIQEADIRNFMSYATSSCSNLFSIGQGIRIHEAIIHDPNNKFVFAKADSGIDLYIGNSVTDIGLEPDFDTQILWHSNNIWVRNQNDGQTNTVHQNPEYDPVIPNYIYVRIKNKGCEASSGNDELKIYWAKANTNLLWDLHWNGSLYIDGVLMGNEEATLIIPSLEPGEEIILETEWDVPNPEDYIGINENPWHFCLLARIVSEDDPMSYPEVTFLPQNVKNNNNIAWKNTTVIDIIPNTPTIGGLVAISNPFNTSKTYSLELISDLNETGKAIYEEAEIGIEMDSILFEGWKRGNETGANFITTANKKKLIANGNNVLIDNIQLEANDYGTVYMTFNFLTKELTNKTKYTYHVIQRDKSTNEIVGGETYEIRKQPRSGFSAYAGDDEEIDRNQSVTLQADTINEDAIYNWYDINGNLIYSGTSITVSPQFTQQYKVEIVSDLDGLKDYDDITVTVNPYRIESLVPNPATTQVTINYLTEGASSSYLMLVNQSTGSSDNYILDNFQTSINIDLSIFPVGLYSVILICDGEIQESKNLAKQ